MRYREVIRPPLWLMALYASLFGSCVFAIWASLDARATLVSALLSFFALLWIWWKSPLHISVDDQLRVGPAHIDLRYIKSVELLDESAMRRTRTRDADPAAFLAIRFWSPAGIKVVLDDPRDPTPYWLITTRKGSELQRALMG